MKTHQPLEKVQPIHSRHFNIQRDYVGLKREYLIPCDEGIGSTADNFDVVVTLEGGLKQSPDEGRVVDDQDFDLPWQAASPPPPFQSKQQAFPDPGKMNPSRRSQEGWTRIVRRPEMVSPGGTHCQPVND